jgi:hypothetical protein
MNIACHNPATDFISISGSVPQSLELCSVEGVKILEAENTTRIDVSNLPSGIYFLRMRYGRDIFIGKIVKL